MTVSNLEPQQNYAKTFKSDIIVVVTLGPGGSNVSNVENLLVMLSLRCRSLVICSA
jgi:hypothetical protein